MLSKLKKKSDATAGPAVPAWHPNFRDYEKLPDVKVVRTTFFVNGAAVSILVALAIYFGINEWQLHILRTQLAVVDRQIEQTAKPSERAVILFKKFQAEEAKVTEVDSFIKSKPRVSTLILRLAESRPQEIALDAIEVRETGLALRFTVRGSAEAAAGIANGYFDQLKNDPALNRFDEVTFVNQSRNPSSGRLIAEFFLHLKGAPKR